MVILKHILSPLEFTNEEESEHKTKQTVLKYLMTICFPGAEENDELKVCSFRYLYNYANNTNLIFDHKLWNTFDDRRNDYALCAWYKFAYFVTWYNQHILR